MKYTTILTSITLATILSTTANSDPLNLPTEPIDVIDLSLEQLLNVRVTTASKQEENLTESPATVVVITQRQIRERGYKNLAELIRDLPGFDLQQYSGANLYNQTSVRGIVNNNKFIIMQDGVRINSPTGERVPIHDNFPLYHAKQVEIVYGPASALYGADAFNGIINIITKKAGDINGIEATALVGQDSDRSAYVNFGKRLTDSITLSAGANFSASDNPDLAGKYPQDMRMGDLITFGGRTIVKAEDRIPYSGATEAYGAYFKLNLNEHYTLGGNYSFFNMPSTIGYEPDNVDYGPQPEWYTSLTTVYNRYEFEANEQLSGMVQAVYSRYEVDEQSKFVNIFNDLTNGFKYARGEKTQIELQLNYALNANNKIITGFSYENYESIPKPTDLSKPYNPDKAPAEQGVFYAGTDNSLPAKIFNVRWDNVGGFVQWRSRWNETLDSTLGIRYDQSSTYGSTVNPRIGLVYKANDKLVLKALYGTAFLQPAPGTAYEHYGSFNDSKNNAGEYTSDFFHIPNPDLKPETMKALELTLAYRATENFNLNWTLFHNQIDDLIFNAPTDVPVADFISGGSISFTQTNKNLGQATAYGGEFRFDRQIYLNNDSKLNLWGNYSYVTGELQRSNEDFSTDLPYTAKHKLKLGLTYKYLDYSISPNLLWIGKTTHFTSEVDHPTQLKTVPEYRVLNLHATAALSKRFEVFLTVTNAFDKRYYNAGGDDSASMYQTPQDPRRVFLGIRYTP